MHRWHRIARWAALISTSTLMLQLTCTPDYQALTTLFTGITAFGVVRIIWAI